MKRMLLILALLAAPLAAQDQKKEEAPKEPQVQKLFVLKYADPNQIANLIKVFATSVTTSYDMHALAVSATKEAMVAIGDAINRLDVPPPPPQAQPAPQNVEMTLYLVVGSAAADGASAPLPKDLESVIAQMRNAFSYKLYRLQDVQIIRTRTGARVDTSGVAGAVQVGGASQPILTQTRIESVRIGRDGSIHVDGLHISSRMPSAVGAVPPGAVAVQFTYNDVGISANVDLNEGQKVVVGKSGMNPEEAMFVVLSARVAQ